MKLKLFILLLLSMAIGCGLIWGPTATVKKCMAAAQKCDAQTMTKLFSAKGIQTLGLDRIKNNNQQFAELCKKQADTNGAYVVDDVRETTNGATSRVSILYHDKSRNDSIRLVFDLSKEGSAWKIDDIGGSEKETTKGVDLESRTNETTPIALPPPPSPPGQIPNTAQPTNSTSRAPISGGVLNAKATHLPQPSYPPVARAAKASGTVTVQVTVDEQGNVISATPVSGHPLLRAAAVAAARQAKFN